MLTDPDRSALRVLLAIFFWFVAYNAVEAFFTLYAKNHLLLTESDGTRLLGQLSLFFVLFAIPSGYLGKPDRPARYHLHRYSDHDAVPVGHVLYAGGDAH